MAAILTSCLEGLQYIAVNGDPANVEFTLVEEPLADDPENPGVGELSTVSGFADLTEAAWTGYARVSKALGAPVDGVWTIASDVQFETAAASDGPVSVPTLAVIVPSSHELIGLWNLAYYMNDGDPLDLSGPNSVVLVPQPIQLFLSTLTAVEP